MSSFGQWYEQQKQQQEGAATGAASAPGSSSGITLSSFSGIFGSESNAAETTTTNPNSEDGTGGGDSSMVLPLFGGDRGVGGGLSGMKQSLEQQLPSKVLGMNYQQRFRMFCALLFISALFFTLGFAVGLPLIYVRPQKFALCFTFGSLTFMGSFSILKGPIPHLLGMFSSDRIIFTAVYLSSMLITLYSTFKIGGFSGYVTVIISSGLQLLALLWYLVTFIPGGSAGMSVLMAGIAKILRPIMVGCAKMWSMVIAKCFGWMVQ